MGELKVIKYDITTAAIEKMRAEYMPLTVSGLDDEAGLELVHKARMEVKGHRVSVEKRRKELKADALAWGKKVDSEAKRITALLEPIETHLQTEEEKVTKELERIRQEKIAAEEKRVQDIKTKIEAIQEKCHPHFVFGKSSGELTEIVNGLYEAGIDTDEFMEFTDQAKAVLDGTINGLKDAIEKRKVFEAEEGARKAEAERLAKQKAEQEAEATRLDAIRKEQEEKDRKEREAIEEERRKIQAEKDKLEAEKRAEQWRKDREEFERKTKEDARIAAEKAEKERVKREAREKKEREEAEAAERARQAALKPDKVKFKEYIICIMSIPEPEFIDKNITGFMKDLQSDMDDLFKSYLKAIDEL